jgi:L-histidine N-alpha-methyltransferase
VLNRELHADFDVDAYDHVARYDTRNEWIEMALRSSARQVVTVADLGIGVAFDAGEEMRTEISAKFRRSGVQHELSAAGLALKHWWTDAKGDFALSLSSRV